MRVSERMPAAIGGTLFVIVMTTSIRAFASGHLPGAPLIFVALLLKLWPLILAGLVGLVTLFGPPSGLKSVVGAASSAVATIGALLFIEDSSPWFMAGAACGLFIVGAHVVRLGIRLLGRATGGRTRETLRKWWRYL